jgi:hypothetical protein
LVGNCFSPKALSLALPDHNISVGPLAPSAQWHPLDPSAMQSEFAALSRSVRTNLLNCPPTRTRNHLELCELIVSSPLPVFIDTDYWRQLSEGITVPAPTRLTPHDAVPLSHNSFLPFHTGLPQIPILSSNTLFSRALSALGPQAANVRQYLNLPDPCEGRPAKYVTPAQFVRLVLRGTPPYATCLPPLALRLARTRMQPSNYLGRSPCIPHPRIVKCWFFTFPTLATSVPTAMEPKFSQEP